jgi:hypothetical protein
VIINRATFFTSLSQSRKEHRCICLRPQVFMGMNHIVKWYNKTIHIAAIKNRL